RGGHLGELSGFKRTKDYIAGKLDAYNGQRRSKANVAHHYDLSRKLYELFLDEDMQYSCAYWTDPGNTLEQAQLDKKAHIASKMDLHPGQRVLDIGCGWGGMALYLRSEERRVGKEDRYRWRAGCPRTQNCVRSVCR